MMDSFLDKYQELAGLAALMELKMRLFASCRLEVQEKAEELAQKQKHLVDKGRDNFLQCDLWILEQAIFDVYSDYIKQEDQKFLTYTRKLRNKLVHAEFDVVMENLGVKAIPVYSLNREGSKKEKINKRDVTKQLVSFIWGSGFDELKKSLERANKILHKLPSATRGEEKS